MAKIKVKDAKNASTDELIYFKSHAKAVYMSDGTTVEDAINNIHVSDSENGFGYPTIDIGDASAVTLKPNVYYISHSASDLTIDFATGNPDVVNEYIIEVKGHTSVSLPDNIAWLNGDIPQMNASSTYIISIINGLASYINTAVPLITFYIENERTGDVWTLQAESETTWMEWVNSEYNTKGLEIYEQMDYVVIMHDINLEDYQILMNDDIGSSESPGDTILDNHTYILIQ